MVILTKKFSEFVNGGDLENDNTTVGLEGGTNAQFNNPWTFLPPGNTGDRPTVAATMYYRLRVNTDLEQYEYYDPIMAMWVQLSNTGALSGPFVIYEADPSLPSAFNLGGLASGLLKQSVSIGVATPAIAQNEIDYYGPGMTGYLSSPAGIKDINGNIVNTYLATTSAVNYLTLKNAVSTQSPTFSVDGTDTNIGLLFKTKNTGIMAFGSANTSTPFQFQSGTALQHAMNFLISNTANTTNVTWQDSSGTVAYLADIPAVTPSPLTRVNDTNVTVTLGGTPATALLQSVSLTLGWTGTLAETRGGTNQSSYAIGDTLYASAANTLSKLTGNITTTKQYLSQTGNGAASAAPVWATIAGTDITGAALTKVDDTNVTLTLGGTPSTALLRAASLTLGWTGQLGETRGGTAQSSYVLGDMLYSSAANTLSKLSGNITAVKQYLSQTGTGAVSAAPIWAAIAGADITGSALTKTDDTNVTLTLGGTPTTALLRAASLTLGWTGQLAVTRGGTGLGSLVQGDLIYGSAANTFSALAKDANATRYLSNQGASNSPSWNQINLANGVTGNLPVTNLNSGSSASATTFWRGDGTWATVSSSVTAPTVQKFTSGSGTYTRPTSPTPLYIRVVAVGGGAGGNGSGPSPGTPGAGVNTTFGTTLIVAGGGGIGAASSTASLGAAIGIALLGAAPTGATNLINSSGGTGGNSAFGGAGPGGFAGLAGSNGIANSGGGGGGGGGAAGFGGTYGGGAGSYVDGIIASPTTSYAYTVGGGGAGGTLGTGGSAGGTGGTGIIVVYEYYQ